MIPMIIERGVLAGYTAEDVSEWLSLHADESCLAIAMAAVGNKTGSIRHEISNDWAMEEVYSRWANLEKELYERIISILVKENGLPQVKGKYFQIQPFMERNGYRAGSGWWIEK